MSFSLNRALPVTDPLGQVTSIGSESPEFNTSAGLIWKEVCDYYRSGISPMVGACIYHRSGDIILNRNIGHVDQHQSKPVDLDTPVCLFSVSKIVTALLIHKLAELGKLKLDKRVSDYLPRYVGGGKAKTTISDLLTHHGGIPRLRPPTNSSLDPDIVFDRQAMLDLAYDSPLIYPVGSNMAYHAFSAGYLLGEIAEKVGGDSLDALLQQYIAKPMQMDCLHYGLPKKLRPKAAKHAATGINPKLGVDIYVNHLIGASLDETVKLTNDDRFYDAFCPAGNVYATTENAARLMFMLLNDGQWQGKEIFAKSSIQAFRHAPHGWRFDYTLCIPMRYGQGSMRGAYPAGLFGQSSAKSYGHLGFTNILCWVDPKRGYAASFVNTGKSVIGTHLPALVKTISTINKQLA